MRLPFVGSPPGIGFVSHDSLSGGEAGASRGEQAPPGAAGKLGSFCTIALRRGLAAPAASAHSRALGRNWLRFAHLTPPNLVRFYSRLPLFGFVLRVCPASHVPRASSRPAPPEIGFVLHVRPSPHGPRPGWRNWVRFARLALVPRPCGPAPPGEAGNWNGGMIE